MPAISDPGEELVAQCAERGIQVLAVPGPTAMATALALSGLPTGRFCFEGFLSVTKQSRRERLEELKDERRTIIFYEAPHKLPYTLKDLSEAFGDRRCAIVRELTKIHEEVIRTTLPSAAERFSAETPKGEIVLVVEGAPEKPKERMSLSEAVAEAKKLLSEGLAATEAAKRAARLSGCKKSDIYRQITM